MTEWVTDKFILPIFDEDSEFKAKILVTASRELEEDGTEIEGRRLFAGKLKDFHSSGNRKYLSKLWDAKIQKDAEDAESAAIEHDMESRKVENNDY